jgi:hypothetical protein
MNQQMVDTATGQSPPSPAAGGTENVVDDAMSAAELNKLTASDFAVPGKRQLPIHDKKHAKLAWDMVSGTQGLSDAEKRNARRRILARLRKFGVDIGKDKAKPVTDADEVESAALELPEDLSLWEFRDMLQCELRETFPSAWVSAVYPGYVLASLGNHCNGNYDDRLYRIGYTLGGADDDDGDVDEVPVRFDFDAKREVRMVPKVIEDALDPIIVEDALDPATVDARGDMSGPGGLVILSDAAELARDMPLRFRLPGPVANKVNGNRRFYPRAVLHDAIDRAQCMIKEGRMISYSPHPEPAQAADGSPRFLTEYGNRAAKIDAWFLDQKGQSWIDRTIIRTQKGREVEASIKAKAAVATSMRAIGKTSKAMLNGQEVRMATYLDLQGDDFVENPATQETWARAQVLTDEQVITLLQTSTPIVEGIAMGAAESSSFLELDSYGKHAGSVRSQELDGYGKHAGNVRSQGAPPATPAIKLEDKDKMEPDKTRQIIPPGPAKAQAAGAGGTHVMDSAAEGGSRCSGDGTGAVSSASGVKLDEATMRWIEEKRAEDARKAQAGSVRQWLLDATEGREVKIGSEQKKFDLSRFSAKELETIRDHVSRHASPGSVPEAFESTIALMDKTLAAGSLRAIGYGVQPRGSSARGTTVEVIEESKPWMPHVEKIMDAMDAFGRRSANTHYFRSEAHIKFAQPFADKLIADTLKFHHGQAQGLLDSSEHFLDDAGTTSLANLMQQPTVTPATIALIYQVFWTLRWLSMVDGIGPEGFNGGPGDDSRFGENLRIAVEGRSSGQPNLIVGENMPIPNYTTQLNWLNFQSVWRKLGFTLSKEAEVQLARGSARYDAIGRQMYAVAMMISEGIDLALANETINASDEYGAVAVTAEAHTSGSAITGSSLTTLGYGGNIAAAYKTSTTVTVTGIGSYSVTIQVPVVPPRHQRTITETATNSQIQDFISNPLAAVVGSTTLIGPGVLDPSSGNIIDDPQGPYAGTGTSQYAVDYENGIFVFVAGTGAETSGVTISYSYATNIDYFALGASANATDLAIFYDGLLRQVDDSAAVMASAPRYRSPNMAVMDYRTAVFFTAARQASQLYQPVGTEVAVTALSPNKFGKRGEVELEKVNTPWRPGQARILLTSNRATKYGIQYPFTVEGPIPNYQGTVQGSKVVMAALASKIYWAAQNSVICTPVGFNVESGAPVYFNHPNRTIKLVGTGSF